MRAKTNDSSGRSGQVAVERATPSAPPALTGYVDGMLVLRGGRIVFEKSYRRDYLKLVEERARGSAIERQPSSLSDRRAIGSPDVDCLLRRAKFVKRGPGLDEYQH